MKINIKNEWDYTYEKEVQYLLLLPQQIILYHQ